MKMKRMVNVWLTAAALMCLIVQGTGFAAVSVQEQKQQQAQINVAYPQFSGIENDYVQKKINMDIKVLVDKFINENQNDQYNQAANLTYTVYYMDAEKISFEIERATYSGGAHGRTFVDGFTYNLKTGETYSLAQLFDFKPSEINQKIFAYAKANDVFLFGGFRGVKVYPNNFYLDKQGSPVILFQHYEIAPYSSGILRIAMK